MLVITTLPRFFVPEEMDTQIRLAHLEDIAALANLIPESARALQANYFTPEQIEGALGAVFGVDSQWKFTSVNYEHPKVRCNGLLLLA